MRGFAGRQRLSGVRVVRRAVVLSTGLLLGAGVNPAAARAQAPGGGPRIGLGWDAGSNPRLPASDAAVGQGAALNRAEKAALAGAVALGTTAAMIRAAMCDPGGSCIGPTIGWGLMGATVGAVMGGLIAGSGPAEDAGHVTQLERSQPLTSHSREERMAGRIGHLAWIAVAVLTIGVLLPSPVSAQSPGSSPVGEGQCRPADAEADHLAEHLRRVLSSTDSADTDLRRDVGITYQPSPFVAQVSDEGVCAQAVAALNARTRTPGRARQVYVYDLGSQYAVDDPEQMAGEYRMLRVFSRQWELRGDILVY